MVALTAAAVGLAGGVIWAAVVPAQTAAVKLEAHATAGDNPFMPPVGNDEASVTPPTGAAGTFSGGTPGLYGQNGDRPSCDTATLVSNLQSDPTKAAAWASALNIRADEIPSYAQSLSPVLLRADTAVTAHGYDAPRYVSYPAVLQAGSAVFVNAFGEPTVKCFNGNPMTQGVQFADASYSGAQWSYFRPGGYTYVRPNRVVINVYNYYDLPKKFIRKFESWCSHHHGAEGCRFPNPKHWCEDGEKRQGCKAARGADNANSGAANHAKPDPKLEANAKKTKDDAATADDAAKKAAGKAQDLEQQAAALKASAESLPEPARSVELARAAQLDQAAKQARADADAKAAEAKKAADAAAQARAESDKAVATTTTGETTTGGTTGGAPSDTTGGVTTGDATTQGTTADTNTDGPTTGDGATSGGGPTTGGDTTTGATTDGDTTAATTAGGGATSGTSTTGPPTTGGSSPFGAVALPADPCGANPQLPQCTAGTSGTSTTSGGAGNSDSAGNNNGKGRSDSSGGSSGGGGSSGKNNDKKGSGG
ncbi:MAG: hypothetical protein M3Z25_12015 [Actinomycetota bacterium]|nr:hypothetical protein [Actinomycetota bacterium]